MFRFNQEGEIKMNKKIISVCNQKGGVGKSTTAFNLGAALAEKHNMKVLLCDLDPQANLSEYLKYTEDNKPTITKLILEVAANSCISPDTVNTAIRYNESLNLYYIPSDINLANAETYMQTALARETILRRILSDEITEQFDYIIIDCLPSLGILLINAMTASDGMIIPVQTQKFSMDGLEALSNLHRQIRSTINSDLDIVGILPTMVDKTVVSRNALSVLTERYGHKLFSTSISKSIEAAKSSESGKALCNIKCKIGDEYIRLADEIVGGI